MSWIQEPEVDALEPMGSVCSCIGATCKGRCTPYAVCLMYLGNKCKQLTVCVNINTAILTKYKCTKPPYLPKTIEKGC